MKKQITILLVTSILVFLLFTGFPIEFRDVFAERIARIIISISIILILFFLFNFTKKFDSKKRKIGFITLLIIISFPYSLVCIYNFSTAFSNNYSRWKDISILEGKDGNKIAYQLRETSGSIYDYRYRKIFYENQSIRISINWNLGSQTGWSERKSNYIGTNH